MLSKSVGTNIKEFRKTKGLSQDDLAAAIFVTRQTVSNYETGHTNPDLDMLQKIAEALDVEVLWLLYGIPATPEKQASKKKTLKLTAAFFAFSAVTVALSAYTDYLKAERFIVIPNIIVRFLFVPLTMALLGALLIQVIDYFLNIGKKENTFLKVGRITTVSLLIGNLLVVLPYVIWCCCILLQVAGGEGAIAMTFPRIPVYEPVAYFFLILMYKYPYLYSFAGMALWLFHPNKRIN